jgi:two-component system OmpR family response regulator
MQILLVEDDAMLSQAMAAGLRGQGWQVECAPDAPAARVALARGGFQAVLLDLGLPRGNGLELLRGMRGRYDATPVLIVSARDRLSERIDGLDAGADDYIVKPFSLDELYARVRALVRRSQGRVSRVLEHGAVRVDPADHAVTLAGARVSLSIHEYRTLVALLERKGRIVPRALLEDAVYGGDGTIESNTIAVYVHQLRRKLGGDLIETVHGFGYRIGAARA